MQEGQVFAVFVYPVSYFGNRTVVVVVIAQNEINRDLEKLSQLREIATNARCLGNITGNEHGLSIVLAQFSLETAEPSMIEEFQVNICKPDRSHGRADSVLNFPQYSIVAHQLVGEKGYPLKGRMPTASRLQ
jgi:hypothetical protein